MIDLEPFVIFHKGNIEVCLAKCILETKTIVKRHKLKVFSSFVKAFGSLPLPSNSHSLL